MASKAVPLMIAGGGAVLLWSALEGKSWSSVLRNVISGQSPSSAPNVNAITTSAAPLAGSTTGSTTSTISGSAPTNAAHYTYAQLEQLWVQAGGNAASAPMAAAIAMAESGGDSGATDNDADGSVDRGLWQINSSHGSLSTYNPLANAKAAVEISGNGTNWDPWVTYQTGAYRQYLQ